MGQRTSRKKVAHRKKLHNRFSMVLVSLVVVVLLVVVGIRSYALLQKREALTNQLAEIERLQGEEEKKAQEIEKYSKYTKTLKFVEEKAKKVFNLVYEDEIIFTPEE